MPCKSSTVWVSKTSFAPVVWAACWAWESWRAAEVDERDLCKILGEREHSWRRSIVDAIEGEGVVGGRCGKVRLGVAVTVRVQSAFGCCPLHHIPHPHRMKYTTAVTLVLFVLAASARDEKPCTVHDKGGTYFDLNRLSAK